MLFLIALFCRPAIRVSGRYVFGFGSLVKSASDTDSDSSPHINSSANLTLRGRPGPLFGGIFNWNEWTRLLSKLKFPLHPLTEYRNSPCFQSFQFELEFVMSAVVKTE